MNKHIEGEIMFFKRDAVGDIVIITVDLARASLNEADEFKKLLSDEIEQGYKKIIVDLSNCDFIDSTFLGSLVVSLKKVTSLGGDLRLIGFKPAVHSMFELTRMYKVFETFKTREDAIASFQ